MGPIAPTFSLTGVSLMGKAGVHGLEVVFQMAHVSGQGMMGLVCSLP